jgi:hypothetical protein
MPGPQFETGRAALGGKVRAFEGTGPGGFAAGRRLTLKELSELTALRFGGLSLMEVATRRSRSRDTSFPTAKVADCRYNSTEMNNALKAKLIKRLKPVFGPKPSRLTLEGLKAVLIDIRDLLELTGDDSRYKVLKFHCDWILHPHVTGPRVRRIIKAVDDECVKSVKRAGLQEWPDHVGPNFFGPVSSEFMDRLRDRFTFYELEVELGGFLGRHGIMTVIAHPSAQTWRDFEVLYCRLIEDRTWDYTNKQEPVTYINRALIQMKPLSDEPSTTSPDPTAFPYFLLWRFLWNDEQRLMLTVSFHKEPMPTVQM